MEDSELNAMTGGMLGRITRSTRKVAQDILKKETNMPTRKAPRRRVKLDKEEQEFKEEGENIIKEGIEERRMREDELERENELKRQQRKKMTTDRLAAIHERNRLKEEEMKRRQFIELSKKSIKNKTRSPSRSRSKSKTRKNRKTSFVSIANILKVSEPVAVFENTRARARARARELEVNKTRSKSRGRSKSKARSKSRGRSKSKK